MAYHVYGQSQANGSRRDFTPFDFAPKPLFGGALSADVPDTYLDASDIRPVPDHQEVFTSDESDTSIIIELLERPDIDFEELQMAQYTGGRPLTQSMDDPLSMDISSVYYHIHDIKKDTRATLEVVDKPFPCKLGKMNAPAYVSQVAITTELRPPNDPEADGEEQGAMANVDPTSAAGDNQQARTHTTTVIHFLLIRLKEYNTDIVVCVNVPHKLYEMTSSAELCAREERFAHRILAKIADTLHVADYSLFVMEDSEETEQSNH